MPTRENTALPTNIPDFLLGGGAVGGLIRACDWSASPLGPAHTWPLPLKTLVGVMLGSNQPMFLAWGDSRTLLYNDAYAEILAAKHPAALGCDFLAVWHEVRHDLLPIVEQAYRGEPVHMDDIELLMLRKGYPEETHFAFSYTPVCDESGQVAGFFCPCREVTDQVLAQRRQAFRLRLEERFRALGDPRAVMDAAVEELGRHLGAARVGYSEVRADGETIDCRSCFSEGVAPLLGTFRLGDFGPESIARQQRGGTEAIADIRADPMQVQQTWAAIDTRAFVSVPLMRDGRIRASLYVNRREPHAWTADEVALIEEVAQRTWAVVERARAEDELRRSEARLRRVLEIETVGVVFFDLVGGIHEANDAFLKLVGHTRAELATGAVRYDQLTPPEWHRRDEETIAALKAAGTAGNLCPPDAYHPSIAAAS